MAEQNRYNPNDGLTGRPTGVYLDQVEAEHAEQVRAKREGREPSDKFQPYAGSQLITEAQLLERGQAVNVPSENKRLHEVKSPKDILAKPVISVDEDEDEVPENTENKEPEFSTPNEH